MDKGLEFFDAWVKSQKEFLDTWSKSQKELMANWTESTKTLQDSIVNIGAAQEGPTKEMTNLFNSLFTTVTNSTKILSEEVGKIQETWKTTFEKQMETSRELVKHFSQFFKQATEKK